MRRSSMGDSLTSRKGNDKVLFEVLLVCFTTASLSMEELEIMEQTKLQYVDTKR
jgi:hypothetical protein